MLQRILLAWDGSAAAKRALDMAIDLARRYQAEIVAVSVAYSPAHAETDEDRRESVSAARRHLEGTLAAVRDRADRIGVSLEQALIEGDHPADELLRYAHEHGFDLLVAGRPRSGLARRVLMHGVAEALAAKAEIPVLIVGTPSDG